MSEAKLPEFLHDKYEWKGLYHVRKKNGLGYKTEKHRTDHHEFKELRKALQNITTPSAVDVCQDKLAYYCDILNFKAMKRKMGEGLSTEAIRKSLNEDRISDIAAYTLYALMTQESAPTFQAAELIPDSKVNQDLREQQQVGKAHNRDGYDKPIYILQDNAYVVLERKLNEHQKLGLHKAFNEDWVDPALAADHMAYPHAPIAPSFRKTLAAVKSLFIKPKPLTLGS